MREGKRDEAEEIKAKVTSMAEELKDLEVKEEEYGKELKEIMMKIPNIIHDSVPIGKDDSENVEIQNTEIQLYLSMKFHTMLISLLVLMV